MRDVPDLLDLGEQRLKSSSLSTFNKRIRDLQTGRKLSDSEMIDIDELPANQLCLNIDEEAIEF